MLQKKRASLLLMPLLMALIAIAFPTNSSAQTGVTLFSFNGTTQGLNPLSNLVMDKAGNLYGTTFVGGAHGSGVVFELSPDGTGGWNESVLYSFTGGADGADPYYAGVVFDAAGNLYGTTTAGGSSNLGTVFQLTPSASGWSETVLHSFAGGSDGQYPYSGVTLDPAGNLYGTTLGGGAFGMGTVYELKPAGNGQWTESVIQAFNGNNGDSPRGGLARDGAGALYGVTQGGGKAKAGVVFKLIPSTNVSWTERVLHSFSGGNDGSAPYTETPVFDHKGNLYGTTSGGGALQGGTVFRLSPSQTGSWSETVVYSFDPTVESIPFSGVVLDAKGNIYGTCGNGNGVTTVGTVFELSPAGPGQWSERDLFSFDRTDGEFPETSLYRDAAGNLYGTTILGGEFNSGVVYEVSP